MEFLFLVTSSVIFIHIYIVKIFNEKIFLKAGLSLSRKKVLEEECMSRNHKLPGLLQEPYPKGLIPLCIIGMVRSIKDNKFQVITKHRIFVFRAESEGNKSHPDPKVPFFSSCYFCFSVVGHYSTSLFLITPFYSSVLHWKWENVERPDFFCRFVYQKSFW